MKNFNIYLIIFSIFIFSEKNISAEIPHFLDFKLILNKSVAGKKAQDFLKNKLDKGIQSLQAKEKNLLEEEKKIIQQKKVLSEDEYKKKILDLRSKVSSLQKDRNKLLRNVAEQRSKARDTLLKNLNPIINDFMKEKKIRMVVDKKSLLLADENLDITNEIMDLLNKKLKSINLK